MTDVKWHFVCFVNFVDKLFRFAFMIIIYFMNLPKLGNWTFLVTEIVYWKHPILFTVDKNIDFWSQLDQETVRNIGFGVL